MRWTKCKAAGVVAVAAAVGMQWMSLDSEQARSNTSLVTAIDVSLASKGTEAGTLHTGTARSQLAGFTWNRNAVQTDAADAAGQAAQDPRTRRFLVPRNDGAQVAQEVDASRVSERLAVLARIGGSRMVDVMLQHDQKPGSAEHARIEALGGQVLRTYDNFPFMAARVPAGKLGELSRSVSLQFMDVNARVLSSSSSDRSTANVPNSGSGTLYPVSGSFGVAVVDSGVASHSDLNVIDRVVFNDSRTSFFGDFWDGFYGTSYQGSYGSEPWSGTPWTEKNDDNSSTAGKIKIASGTCPWYTTEECLQLSANATTSTAVERTISVLGAREAYLYFDREVRSISSTAAFVLEISANGGTTWTTLDTFNAANANTVTYNVTPYISARMKIRFRVSDTDSTAMFSVDNMGLWFRTSSYFRDDFDSVTYNSNSWGTEVWNGSWWETGDGTTSPTAGTISISNSTSCPTSGNNCARIDAGGGVNDALTRSLNLSGVFSAAVSFDYKMATGWPAGTIVLEASKDNGATWGTLGSFNSAEQVWDKRFDLTPYVSSQTQIRFRVSNAVAGSILRVDNIEVDVERGNTSDMLGHGTHIAGIIGGNGGTSGQQPGVAKGARIHSVRVLDGRGRGTVADLVAGLDWIYSNGASRGIKVVNLSLGTGVSVAAANDPLVIAAERLWDAGFVVVASAGNYGVFGNMTITSPGTARKVITVGSLTDNGTGTNYADDYVSTYSSRGPTLFDHVLKPDLIAPGNRYIATIPSDSRLKSAYPERQYNCGTGCATAYMEMSGTSMAAAQVSGAVLLMLTKESGLNPSTVKARLMRSARKMAGSDATATGAGVLNVQAALSQTGYVYAQALSPKMARSDAGSAILVEDTGYLWQNTAFGAGYLWQNGYLWSNNYSSAAGYLWSDGYLWQNGYLWSNGYLWNNGYLWQNGYLWNNGYLWEDATAGADGLASTAASAFDQLPD